MPVPERDETKRNSPNEEKYSNGVDPEEVSERIGEALEPAFSEFGLRVAEAVTQNLRSSQSGTTGDQPSEDPNKDGELSLSSSPELEPEQTARDEQEESSEEDDDSADTETDESESKQTARDEQEESSEEDDDSADTETDESEPEQTARDEQEDSSEEDDDSSESEADDSESTEPDDDTEDQSLIGKAASAFHQAFSGDDSSDDDGEESKSGRHGHDADDDESLLGQASGALYNSFTGSILSEGDEQLESFADRGVDMLFSRRGKGWMRRLADQTLQASLYDILGSVDDPDERNQLYRENLGKLRPIVRNAVDAMYTEESRATLKRELHGAIPRLLHGDFNTAFSMLVEALSDVTDHAEEEIWDHSAELLQVVQQISTKLLQEHIEDAAEEKFDPEEIQQKMQDKAEEARSTIQEKVGALQGSVQGTQEQLGGASGGLGGTGGSGRTGMPPQGGPPNGFPPFGKPPNGKPPSGRPPSGRPPNGLPPNGVHPAAKRRQRGTTAQTGRPRTRRTPER